MIVGPRNLIDDRTVVISVSPVPDDIVVAEQTDGVCPIVCLLGPVEVCLVPGVFAKARAQVEHGAG